MHHHGMATWAAAIKSARWEFLDTLARGPCTRYADLMASILSLPPPRQPPRWDGGLHFLYCNHNNRKLGSDGYDNYQAPVEENGREMFSRRMWVRGSLDFHPGTSAVPMGADLVCRERVTAVRRVEPSVFVGVEREFGAGTPLVTEARTLVYTNEAFTAAEGRPVAPIPDDATSAHVQVDPAQLINYSMLTANLHRIHYDAAYCRGEGLREPVVHGPLMVSLVLSWLTATTARPVARFRYKNREPWYAGTAATVWAAPVSASVLKVGIDGVDDAGAPSRRYFEGTLEWSQI